ncbi:thiolase family protein [Amycolatopsis rhabdoformis]|uniref:Thiolase family protein n=1 Tax=Amycolatopsis rhabdoformis TaxID=1448059 RepID=A0ABZ1IDR3_9PSEU|nr:thiolase family protein [Amycolatopsis rhabdoformis]WSE32585.1 thiolase family protein [Amycolatopsis rhabdoformis]
MSARRVAVAGYGLSTIGRDTGLSVLELCTQAIHAALADTGLRPADVDGLSAYSFAPDTIDAYGTAAAVGMTGLTWVAGMTEGPAFAQSAVSAAMAVASGMCDTVIALRAIRRHTSTGLPHTATVGGDRQFTQVFGGGQPVQWAGMYQRRLVHELGWDEAAIGTQVVAQRRFATMNPEALHRAPLTLADYEASPFVSAPIRLLDCDYPVDAGAAVVFTTEERARDLAAPVVLVDAYSLGVSGERTFEHARDVTRTASHAAAAHLWRRTDWKPGDVDVAGLYDGFSFVVLDWLEALGLCERGGAADFVLGGGTAPGGRLPVNCDGGAANVGRIHGVNHVIEVVRQLRAQSGPRQVGGARVGVVSNAIGPFAGCLLLTNQA